MKFIVLVAVALAGAFLFFPVVRITNEFIAPLFLNSRLERLGETHLPQVSIQGNTVYCRMKADDFRFPLPPGSRAANPVVRGGFDTVKGSVEARFDGQPRLTADEYEAFLSGKVQVGGHLEVRSLPDGLLIRFSYFGDR